MHTLGAPAGGRLRLRMVVRGGELQMVVRGGESGELVAAATPRQPLDQGCDPLTFTVSVGRVGQE